MNTPVPPSPPPTLSLADIYYVLFRHKWKIVLCSALGIVGAILIHTITPTLYQSEARLLVRYIVAESKSSGPAESPAAKILVDERGASIMMTEREILSSLDLAEEVARAIGPEKILSGSGKQVDLNTAKIEISKNLRINVSAASPVIHLTYRHRDPEMVQPVLGEIIKRYLNLHLEAHRSSGMLGDKLAQEADTLRYTLNQTEEALRKALSNAGIISLESAKENFIQRMAQISRELSDHETELAGRIAVLEEIKKRSPAAVAQAQAVSESADIAPFAEQYQELFQAVSRYKKIEQDLRLQFTPEMERVKTVRIQLQAAQKELDDFMEKHGSKLRVPAAGANPGSTAEASEAATQWLQITAYQARIKRLNAELEQLKADAARVDQNETEILRLRRAKQQQEAAYSYYAANLQQAQINESLGSGKVSNIKAIQNPSVAFRDPVDVKKPGLIVLAGILAGLGWAFLLEFYLDRSIRRPADIQKLVGSPLFLSIPRLHSIKADSGAREPLRGGEEGNRDTQLALADSSKQGRQTPLFQLRAFHETLRDRLIGFFESQNMTHKPKLVAVTGLGSGAGVTTTATGLARSLSETGEGNVLLVDMTAGQGAALQFAKGKEVCGLDELLETRSHAHVHENLYVVSETSNSERLSRNLPQRFNKLIPKLKASDFDYIIFDMPTVSQLSITPRLASFMDMVLLVVESEKTDRDIVMGGASLLAESRAHLGIVLNKVNNYVPRSLQQELLST
jgi:polysaccharide biosynthesis transport protein